MGDWFQIIVDREASEEEAPALGSSIRDWLVTEGIIEATLTDCVLGSDLGYPPGPNHERATDEKVPELWTNGLDIITGRTVFHSTGVETYLICSQCGERFQPPDEWTDAIGEWYDRRGPGLLSCIRCNYTEAITKWQHDPPWGFGNLGFEFWNWPPLNASFIEEVSKRLGHRVVYVEGKL